MKVIRALDSNAASPAELEARALADRLAAGYARSVKYYLELGGLSLEEAHQEAKRTQSWAAARARTSPPRELDWHHLSAVAEVDLPAAQELWTGVKAAAREELRSGDRAAAVMGPMATPFQKAQFLALRESFVEGWKPQNGIELAMIDMLAQSSSLYTYWNTIAHERATNISEESRRRSEDGQSWALPRQFEADAIEQAGRLADGFNRQFLRTLRQLRDLRRYTQQIVVMNGGQVNVAQQQVNVSKPSG